MKNITLLILSLIVLFSAQLATADIQTHKYTKGETVVVFANKVGPFHNPQEYYYYYSLPYCEPTDVDAHYKGLGEAIQGYELRKSSISLSFGFDLKKKNLCEVTLTEEQANKFTTAVTNQYWYQMFVDDLPVWGMVGEAVDGDNLYVYTHKHFDIAYNLDRVIEVNLTSENPVPFKSGTKLSFSYSVSWIETKVPFEKRFEKYLDNGFFEHQIHWFSVFNSLMLVIFLVGLVAMILMRTLRKEYGQFSSPDDIEDDMGEESGWKQIHGDVFRAPSNLVLFSALVGTGNQLISLVLLVLSCAILGAYYKHRGTLTTAFVISYIVTSIIAGFSSGGYYLRNKGRNWIKVLLLTTILFPSIIASIALSLNFVASFYNAQNFIPFLTIVILFALWALVAFPLTIFGTILGRNWNGAPDNICRISQLPRHIPEKPWYLHPFFNIILGGVMPFASIFIETYFLFTSFWHYKYYYVYGFMLLVFLILIVVTSCVTIVSTYFLLNTEDYRWQWISFLSGASTAFYVYLYAIYYYWSRTQMSGFLQTIFYFGYMAMFCSALAILCGGIGFFATSVFVRRIYQYVKID